MREERIRHGQTERLVDAWQAGTEREECFRRLFQACSPGLVRFFRQRGFTPEQCEDLVQETFLGVFRGLARFRREVPFEDWLFALAANASRKALRRESADKRRREEISLDDPALAGRAHELPEDKGWPPRAGSPPTALRRLLAKEDLQRVCGSLDVLPERMRSCVVLALRYGLSAGRIASLLRISPSTVKVQLYRARRRLSSALAESCPRPGATPMGGGSPPRGSFRRQPRLRMLKSEELGP